MNFFLSLVIITKNAAETLDLSLKSVRGLVDEIILVDDYSDDKTVKIAKKYQARIYIHHEKNLGKQKAFGIKKAKGKWILLLDADEYISKKLKKEIEKLKIGSSKIRFSGFYIPFQNHFFGRPVNYGGENYKKLILFEKKSVFIRPALVHEKVELKKGKAGKLNGKVLHYSYRSLRQMFCKFTDYAKREAIQKAQNQEKSSIKKLFLYPIHMFWARFIKDKGYKDGWFRIPLDLGFAYMEFFTYLLLYFYNWKILKIKY